MNLCLRLAMSWVGRRAFTSLDPPVAVAWQSVTANGSDGTVTTTELTLEFDVDPGPLTVDSFILFNADITGISGTGTGRVLTINNIVDTALTLSVTSPAGYAISPDERSVTANIEAAETQVAWETLTANGSPAPAAVAWESLAANGDSETETTALTFTFDVDPTSLTASDIALTNCTKGALSGTGLTRTLAVSEITDTSVQAAITNPDGFDIDPLVRTVSVFEAPAATVNKLLSTDNLPSGDDWSYNLVTDNGLDAFGARILEAQAGGTGERRVSQADVPLPPDTYEMFSFYAKYDDHKYLGWRVSISGAGFRNIVFDLETGVAVTGANASRYDTYSVSAADVDAFRRYSFRLVGRDNEFVSLVMFNDLQEHGGTVAVATSVSVKNVQIENGSTLTDYSAGA